PSVALYFLFTDRATTDIYPLSLHDALPILAQGARSGARDARGGEDGRPGRLPELYGCRDRPEGVRQDQGVSRGREARPRRKDPRSEEHTSELQSRGQLVCRRLPEK